MHHFIFSPTVHKGSNFSTSLSTLVTFFFNSSYFNGCEVISLRSFDLYIPNDQWSWAPFHVLVGHLYIFFREMLIQVLCPFFKIMYVSGVQHYYLTSVHTTKWSPQVSYHPVPYGWPLSPISPTLQPPSLLITTNKIYVSMSLLLSCFFWCFFFVFKWKYLIDICTSRWNYIFFFFTINGGYYSIMRTCRRIRLGHGILL